MKVKNFSHPESIYNFQAAFEVVPILIDLFKPLSVVDVGCGLGTWLKVFEDHGISDFIGIDGSYIKVETLKIAPLKFIALDLENSFRIQRRFDLVLSLEVAEHLKSTASTEFVQSLCELGEIIIFSAAIKNQGGQFHINEQNPDYWISKFRNNGFELFDVLRPIFWNNKKVDWWYRQNIMVFTRNANIKIRLNDMLSFHGQCFVHPEALNSLVLDNLSLRGYIQDIDQGKRSIKFYLKLLLRKISNSF
jgi:SAM-dependent methyltransferase